jgi:hypothetical protein
MSLQDLSIAFIPITLAKYRDPQLSKIVYDNFSFEFLPHDRNIDTIDMQQLLDKQRVYLSSRLFDIYPCHLRNQFLFSK